MQRPRPLRQLDEIQQSLTLIVQLLLTIRRRLDTMSTEAPEPTEEPETPAEPESDTAADESEPADEEG
jgi:hypothetical protein